MKVGIHVYCNTCGHQKQPVGRSASMMVPYCTDECSGYGDEPRVGDLWPGETEEDFGYPVCSLGTVERVLDPIVPKQENGSESEALSRLMH